MRDNPCKNCMGHSSDCHAKCDKYLSWKDEYEKNKAAYYKERNMNKALDVYSMKNISKTKRYK